MLPLLRRYIKHMIEAPLSQEMLLYPLTESCTACPSSEGKAIDYSICSAYGKKLIEAIDAALAKMHKARVFDAWLQMEEAAANVYGGEPFKEWVPDA